jgi:hypothetical protein
VRPLTRQLSSSDRADDVPLCAAGETKPPILRRRTLRTLAVVALVLIVFGTLGPLGTGAQPWLTSVAHWQWSPQPTPTDFNDAVTNFVVYMPVGIAFRLLVRRRGLGGLVGLRARLSRCRSG